MFSFFHSFVKGKNLFPFYISILFLSLFYLLLSIITLINLTSKTDRYTNALDDYNKIISNNNYSNFIDGNSKNYYLDSNGDRIKLPSKTISNMKFFKIWKKTEVIIVSIRLGLIIISTGISFYLFFNFWVIQETKKYFKYFPLINILLYIILFCFNLILLIMRYVIKKTDNEIGFFNLDKKNIFKKYMNYGITVDITGIIISCINIIIELCIFLKINNMYKTEINPSNIVNNQTDKKDINENNQKNDNKISNDFNENNFNPNNPYNTKEVSIK